jgi:hypothetical protein
MFSFAGYPLDQVEEATSGLKYFACIIENIKSSIAPWNSIGNQKRDTILSRMMELMTKRVVLHPEVHYLINPILYKNIEKKDLCPPYFGV